MKKITTAERDPHAVAKLSDLIRDMAVAMITTVTPDGALRSRPMVTQQMRGEGELVFVTSSESGAAHDLADEQAVNVSYADLAQQRYVSVSGNATLSRDMDRLHEVWDPAMEEFFPQGLDDPHLALLIVRIETAEYWDAPNKRMVALHEASHVDNAHRPAGESEHIQVDIRGTPASG